MHIKIQAVNMHTGSGMELEREARALRCLSDRTSTYANALNRVRRLHHAVNSASFLRTRKRPICRPTLPTWGIAMSWYFYVAYFFGGAFLANSIPHIVNGISGRSFPTLLASPPGKGLSSPTVNVLYGAVNLAIGYFLVCHLGEFHIRHIPDVLVLGAGGLLLAVVLSRALGHFYRGQ